MGGVNKSAYEIMTVDSSGVEGVGEGGKWLDWLKKVYELHKIILLKWVHVLKICTLNGENENLKGRQSTTFFS